MKIGILFNCQHKGLKLSLQALLPRDEVYSVGLPTRTGPRDAFDRALAQLTACDIIVAVPASSRNVLGEALQAAGARMVTVPSVAFTGYHPDTINIIGDGGKLAGPTGLLHSRIAVAAFLGGLSAPDTADLYNRMIFKRLGYIDDFSMQQSLLHERFSRHGIDVTQAAAQWHAQGCFMHNFTHPKAVALFGLGQLVCGVLGLAADPGAVIPPDTLADHASHPVHPDLAAAFGVQPETHFRAGARRGDSQLLSLDEYLAQSFTQYAATPRADLLTADGLAAAAAAIGVALPDAPRARERILEEAESE